MTIFVFDKSLESGIELIDEQHKRIIEVANIFFVSYDHGHASQKAPETIAFLEQYILYHFNAEEAYLSSSGYPKFREHQAQHSYLSSQLKFHSVCMAQSGYSLQTAQNFHDFFRDWITTHILAYDIEFFKFYKSIL